MKNDEYIKRLIDTLDLDDDLINLDNKLCKIKSEIGKLESAYKINEKKVDKLGKSTNYEKPVLRKSQFYILKYLIGSIFPSLILGLLSLIILSLLSLKIPSIDTVISSFFSNISMKIFKGNTTEILAMITWYFFTCIIWMIIINLKSHIRNIIAIKYIRSVHERSVNEYFENIKQDELKVNNELIRIEELKTENEIILKKIESLLKEESSINDDRKVVLSKLEKIYDSLNLLKKYRNTHAVCSFIENFQIERCYDFVGPNGAYSLYEQEVQAKNFEKLMEKNIKASSDIKAQNEINTMLAIQMQTQNELDRMQALNKILDEPYVEDENSKLLKDINQRLDRNGFKKY